MKRCYSCKIEKGLVSFYKSKNRELGYDLICKECKKKQMREYHSSGKFKIAYKKFLLKNPHYAWSKNTLKVHRKRGYIVTIKPKELTEITKKTILCSICGIKLKWNQGKGDGKLKKSSPTLDRINNENIINLHNIQIICHSCNTTKSHRNMEEFIDYCKMIVTKYTPKEAMLIQATSEPNHFSGWSMSDENLYNHTSLSRREKNTKHIKEIL